MSMFPEAPIGKKSPCEHYHDESDIIGEISDALNVKIITFLDVGHFIYGVNGENDVWPPALSFQLITKQVTELKRYGYDRRPTFLMGAFIPAACGDRLKDFVNDKTPELFRNQFLDAMGAPSNSLDKSPHRMIAATRAHITREPGFFVTPRFLRGMGEERVVELFAPQEAVPV